MEVELHRGIIVSEHIRIVINPYGKVKTFEYLGSSVKNLNYIQEEIAYILKNEIHAVIHFKHFCPFDFTVRI